MFLGNACETLAERFGQAGAWDLEFEALGYIFRLAPDGRSQARICLSKRTPSFGNTDAGIQMRIYQAAATNSVSFNYDVVRPREDSDMARIEQHENT